VVPEGKMRVVGIKAKKISSTKAVLIVKIISPPSLKNVQMQMFCTNLETKTTVTRILPLISIDVIVVLSVA